MWGQQCGLLESVAWLRPGGLYGKRQHTAGGKERGETVQVDCSRVSQQSAE